MKIRSLLTLTAVISITVFSSANTTVAQIDRPITMIKKSDGQFDLNILLNAFYENGKDATQRDLQKNLDIVLSLLEQDPFHAQELGFGEDSKGARIPPNALPVFIFHVGLKDLRDFVPDKEASDLLMFTNQLLFPVEVKGDIKSSVTVRLLEAHKADLENKEPAWRITRWGLPKLITQLNRLTEKLPSKTLGILVSIPSLNRNFLGYVDGTDIKLVPLVFDQFFKKEKPEKPLSAKEVFLALVQEAKSVSVDDSPR